MMVESVVDCVCSLFLLGLGDLVFLVFRPRAYQVRNFLVVNIVPSLKRCYVCRETLEESRWSVPRIAQVLTRVQCFQRASSTSSIVMFSTLAHRERAAPESTWAWSPQASETTRGMSRFGARWARWFFDSLQELTWSRKSLIIPLRKFFVCL